jgi:HK97 gp10 family phage protein
MARVTGIEKTIMELRKFGKEAEEIIADETENIAFQIEKDAKKLAPKNFGKLAQSISHEKVSEFQWKVTVNETYGAYMEFGTGRKVKIPAEFADMAATFKGKRQGSFNDGLEAIKIWCRAKGIDEKAAYPIFAKILGAGVNPQPFLYPAWIKGKKDYLKNLEKELRKLNRRI